jgi:hypothetical protein
LAKFGLAIKLNGQRLSYETQNLFNAEYFFANLSQDIAADPSLTRSESEFYSPSTSSLFDPKTDCLHFTFTTPVAENDFAAMERVIASFIRNFSIGTFSL